MTLVVYLLIACSNAAMASTGLEISVTPGFTDQDTYDSMIVDLCPQFARSDYVTSQHSINFAGGGTQAIKKPYNRRKGGGKGEGRGRGGGRGGRGTGTPYQKQVIRDIIYPKGQLSCSIVGCTNILSIPKSDTFRATDKNCDFSHSDSSHGEASHCDANHSAIQAAMI